MDDPNITMEEYIRLEEEKARKHGKVFNWETAKYGKIWYDEDIHDLRPVETKFPAISFNDENAILSHYEFMCQDMALPPRDQRHQYLRYEGLQYTEADIEDFESRLARIYRREVHRVQVFDFGGLPDLIAKGMSVRMLMEHRDVQGEAPELEAVYVALGLHTGEETESPGFARYWAESARQIPDKGDLRDYWIGISYAGDLLSTVPSYIAIWDLILRLCYRLIACSIARRSQAPEKVTMTNLFYLRGMDIDSVNVPYLLARYLRLFAAGRKSEAHISGGQFMARLAEHFGLLIAEILGGLTVIAPELSIIDMAELVRLQICEQLDDT
ncbi:hypothetical protein Tco_0596422 [Tanacetum coccineum]